MDANELREPAKALRARETDDALKSAITKNHKPKEMLQQCPVTLLPSLVKRFTFTQLRYFHHDRGEVFFILLVTRKREQICGHVFRTEENWWKTCEWTKIQQEHKEGQNNPRMMKRQQLQKKDERQKKPESNTKEKICRYNSKSRRNIFCAPQLLLKVSIEEERKTWKNRKQYRRENLWVQL